MLINSYRYASTFDADAVAYLNAVEKADNASLEAAVWTAVNAFVVGCKADGIWTAIKASCILAGARTLSGALVPLVGTAPTNNNFVSDDYNRKTGLKGDKTSKYIDASRFSNSDPQSNHHFSVFVNTPGSTTTGEAYIATRYTTITADLNAIVRYSPDGKIYVYSRNPNDGSTGNNTMNATGLIGVSRSASNAFIARIQAGTVTPTGTNLNVSYTPSSSSWNVFARPQSTRDLFSDARLAFYSIGESLNLALLDSRVTTLINAIAAAIP